MYREAPSHGGAGWCPSDSDESLPALDGEPGQEVQLDTGWVGWLTLPERKWRRFRAWIFTAVRSRHRFVYPTLEETTARAIEACEAAWDFLAGIFNVIIPDNTKAIRTRCRRHPRSAPTASSAARDDLDVLVVDVDAEPAGSPTRGFCALGCQPVDLLDFVHQVLLQFLLAQHPQDATPPRKRARREPRMSCGCSDRPSGARPPARARLHARSRARRAAARTPAPRCHRRGR
jgi:hypothetical protein